MMDVHHLNQLSSFTSNHGQHDSEWVLPGARPKTLFCLACAVETFEDLDVEVSSIRKRHLLGELLKAINSHEKHLLDLLAQDSRVAWHLTQTVYGMLDVSDESLSALVIEVLVQLCCKLKSEELVCFLAHQISNQIQQAGSFPASLGLLTLLGQLLHSIPGLVQTLSQNEDSLIARTVTGLTYPDEKVKSSCAFILAHVIGQTLEGSRQDVQSLTGELVTCILPMLVAAQSKELKVNGMGLLKNLLQHESPTRALMQQLGKASLASVLKKMLLSRDSVLQVTSVQCTTRVLLHHKAQPNRCQYADELLNGDIAEFLYEALATTNGLLLSSTFCCLLLFTEFDSFFSKCHTVYGIESIVRAVQQSAILNNEEALRQGLQLLAEIFKKQPEDVHLLSNEATLTQLFSILTDCLTHTETDTVIHASQTLANLLRRDHLPSPIPFQLLTTSLQSLLDTLHRLPKPLVTSGHRSQGNRRSQHRQERSVRAQTRHERVLSEGFRVIGQAFRLAAVCLADPSATESQFTAPESSQGTDGKTRGSNLDSLRTCLLKALDETCIPLVMANFDNITLPDIFTSLFDILCTVMESGLTDTKNLSIKLASSSFIQLALLVKSRFPSQDGQLQDVVNSFLSLLCSSLQDTNHSTKEQQSLKDCLLKALPQIQGTVSEMLHLLYEVPQAVGPCTSNALGDLDATKGSQYLKQHTCLMLLYYAFLHGDKLVPLNALNDALLSFLTNHPNLKELPTSTARHLLLLLATCHGNSHGHQLHPAVQTFMRTIEERDMSSIYTHHPCIIDWCFGPTFKKSEFSRKIYLNAEFLKIAYSTLLSISRMKPVNKRRNAQIMLTMEQCLLHSCSETLKNGTVEESTVKLLRMNPMCFQIILDIMSSGNDRLVHQSLGLLQTFFCSDNMEEETEDYARNMVLVLRERLGDIVQRIFISEEQSTTETHILALLRLACSVHRRYPQSELDAVDVKLVYHVTNLISKTASNNTEILQASLNYLTCLLIRTATNDDTRVMSVLLSSPPTLQHLEGLLSQGNSCRVTELHCCSLSLLSQIISCQAKFNLKVPRVVKLDLNRALELLHHKNDIITKVCGIQLWTAIFNTKFESSVVTLVNKSATRILRENEDVGLAVSVGNLKSIYAWLQNGIVQCDHLLGQAAVTCLWSLITYLQGASQALANHLLYQPWNHHLINHCLESSLDVGILPTHVIQLITVFVQCGNPLNVISIEHLETLVSYLKSLDVSCHSIDQRIQTDALLLAQQIITQPDVKLTTKAVQGLHGFLQQLTNPTKCQSLTKRRDDVVQIVDVVLQHPACYKMTCLNIEQMVTMARDLLDKLGKYHKGSS